MTRSTWVHAAWPQARCSAICRLPDFMKTPSALMALAQPPRALLDDLWREDRPQPGRQADCRAPVQLCRHLVGQREHCTRRARRSSNCAASGRLLQRLRRVYVVDGYAGWDPQSRLKIRIICARAVSRAVHAQHAHPADGRGAGRFRPARLCDLQRRPASADPTPPA